MHILLKLTPPPAHWVGLANIISHSDGLRDDVTLIVSKEGAKFVDEKGREVPSSISNSVEALKAADTLQGKLTLLAALHAEFPVPPPAAPTQSRLKRALPHFHKSGAIGRAIHFGATSGR
jgi:hypothetical protein